ncbi:MAG: phage tail tape measure protein, partial [Nitrososphaerota archaeon]
MARQLIIPFLITANYQTSLAIRQLRGELGQLPTELTALRAAAAEVYAIGAMGLFSFGMLAVGAQQLASALLAAQRMAALAAVASGQFAAASAVANQILRESASIVRGTGVDLQSVSAAFLEAARAGLTLQESVSLLPQALRLAVTSGGDVAEVFRMTFAIMRNMGIPITEETAKTLTSQLSYALDQSLMDIEDVMHAIKYVGPIAGQLRIPLHDLFAALMMLHDAGIRASIAGTGLARLLIRLQAPTMQARRQLAALGVDWRELQPIGRNLADIFDLLITRADATTIRLILGERAERAFYAIIQQGTERLRQYSEELRAVGENAEYLELKFKALLKTPAFRFQAALQDIRTAGSMLIEPFVKLQLAVLESISAALKAIADSPALRAITKLAIGFGSLVGTAALLASTLSWIIGRFLELGTIGTHFLLVLDRLQASLKSLTLSALFTPIRGLWLGLRTLLTGGGTERLASLVAERLRISELASAIAQPLIFFRRARRIHPLLQPLPEYFALEFGSAAAAAAQLGIPIEQFLLAGLTYGGMRATIPTFRKLNWTEILASYYTAFLENFLMNFEDTLLRSVARTGKVFIRPPTLPKGELTRRIINAISDIQAKNFTEWLIAVQQKIFEGIAVQESIIRAAELTTLGYAGTDLVERQRAASAFAEQFDRLIAANIRQFKTALATGLAAIPEIQVITRVSREAQEAVDRFLNQILLYLPVESLQPALESFYRSIQGIANNLNKQAQPFLKEYQRKVQAVLRSANIDEFVRSLLLGAIALPTDALTEASYLAIGATTGLMAGKVPIKARQLDRYITDLAKEFSSFMQGITDVTSAAVWLG